MSTTEGAGSKRSARVQRLMDNADQAMNLLSSLDDFAPSGSGYGSTGLGNSRTNLAMSTDTFHFSATNSNASEATTDPNVLSASNGHLFVDDDMSAEGPGDFLERATSEQTANGSLAAPEDAELGPVVSISVRKGFLHVKGIFPDHSVEYVDIDPRFTTIRELKLAFCEKRQSAKDLGFSARDARVMFDGQLVEDDWLVVDCGMMFNGVIHIVKAMGSSGIGFFGSTTRFSSLSSGSRADPRLSISSIADAYAAPVASDMQVSESQSVDSAIVELSGITKSLSLASSSQGGALSRHIRPEETSFAEIISDFYEYADRVQDTDRYCEKLLEEYVDVLQAQLVKLEKTASAVAKTGRFSANSVSSERIQTTIRELRDERNTWRLLLELRQVCSDTKSAERDGGDALMLLGSESDDLNFEMMEDDAIRLLETQNENYKIQLAVKRWLENMASERIIAISDKRDASASRTLKVMKTQLYPGEDSIRMDPDAVLRDGDEHILEDDMEDEAELLKVIWNYVRAGRVSDAVELCVRLGQAWRAASLSGGAPLGVSDSAGSESSSSLERWGNPLRALWKSTCWKFSEQGSNGNISKPSTVQSRQYENLVYAAMSGNVEVIVKSAFCGSWEDHCWAFLHGLIEHQQDEILYKLLQVKTQSSQLIAGNNAHNLRHYSSLLDKMKYLKRYQVSLDSLFDELRESKNDAVRAQANQPHCLIQTKLVTAKFDHIISGILDALMFNPSDDSYNWDLQLDANVQADATSPSLLRFAAHFVLFAKFTDEPHDEQAGHMILKMYIRHLVKHRQLQLVPIYVAQLPLDGAVEIYVQMLSTVEDHLEREVCVKRILEYSSMDIVSIVVRTVVERMCEHYRAIAVDQIQGSAFQSDAATTAIDRKRIKMLEFLCFYCEHRAEAVARSNLLAREFVLEGKFAAFRELVEEALPEDSPAIVNQHRAVQSKDESEIDACVREFLCWQVYVQAGEEYNLWRSCVAEAATLTLYSEEKIFLADVMYHVSRATSAILEVLRFENGWMLNCSRDESQDATVRRLCLPQLVFNLHSLQLESTKIIMRLKHYPLDAKVELARPLLVKSLEVADVVADEHYAVFKALEQEQCRDLLRGFRESSVALAFMEQVAPHVGSEDARDN